MTARRFEIFIIVVIIACIGIIYAFTQKPVQAPTTQEVVKQVSTTTIEYLGQDGKNALELLKNSHQVEAKQYSFGSFVNSIDGTAPDDKHFWALYVNGQFSQVAADTYITKSTDNLKWQIDEIK